MHVRVWIVTAIVLLAPATVSADFESGLAAYKSGAYSSALPEFRLLAFTGHAAAQTMLGIMHYRGEGVPRDFAFAAEWFRRAAAQGRASSQLWLGMMYYKGEGVPRDFTLAAEWFRRAADQGDASSQDWLGMMYYEGEGVPQDSALAAEWSQRAADQGRAGAQNRLGIMHYKGEGVPRDFTLAAEWFRRAADQGHAGAQNRLGIMHYWGEGVLKDFARAKEWLQKAAYQGIAEAQRNLGSYHSLGQGVPLDYVSAYAWTNLAAAQGHRSARESRDELQLRMTVSQIAQAQSLSRELESRIARGDTNVPIDRIAPPHIARTPISGGSGFWVGSGREVLTNHHVVQECGQITVKHSGESQIATVRATDPTNDLALLVVPLPSDKTAAFSEAADATLGEPVILAGYPLSGLLASDLHVTFGNVSALAGLGDDSTRIQITAPVQPGNSGGPLLDESGRVIGIVVSRLNDLSVARATGTIPQNVNFAIKGSLARMFLEIHGVPYRRAPAGGLSPKDIASFARGFTVAVECWR